MSKQQTRKLSRRLLMLGFLVGCLTFVLAKPPKAWAAPCCEDCATTYGDPSTCGASPDQCCQAWANGWPPAYDACMGCYHSCVICNCDGGDIPPSWWTYLQGCP